MLLDRIFDTKDASCLYLGIQVCILHSRTNFMERGRVAESVRLPLYVFILFFTYRNTHRRDDCCNPCNAVSCMTEAICMSDYRTPFSH